MKKYLLLLSFCFTCLINCYSQPLNFDFEKLSYSDHTQPWSWFPATYGNAVKVNLDSTEKFEGKYSLKIQADETADIAQPYTYQFIIEPKYLIGHKIKFSGNIKTENLSDHATIMIAQYAGESFTLNDTASLNFEGISAWRNFEIICTPVDSINNM
ncbi:MAG: hypothetical protein H7Y00_06295, partial [Fimbriimonadaceae bacterium]|nr:hypothetical protein [Chitinophagales bacterium]